MLLDLLKKQGIPAPTTLVADMIALKIDAMPPVPNAPYRGQGVEELPFRDTRLCVVRDLYNTRVWLFGQPEHAVKFTGRDHQTISKAFDRWRDRSVALSELQTEARNQEGALDLLEAML